MDAHPPTEQPAREDPPERVQVNVRLPADLRDQIDARRAPLGLSRDEWIKRALMFAMNAPTRRRSPAQVTAVGKRTVRTTGYRLQ